MLFLPILAIVDSVMAMIRLPKDGTALLATAVFVLAAHVIFLTQRVATLKDKLDKLK